MQSLRAGPTTRSFDGGRRLETSSGLTPSFFHEFGNENRKLGEKLSSRSTWSRWERILQVEGVLYRIYTFLQNQLLCSYMNGHSESFKIPSSCSRTMTPSTGDCPRYTWRNSKSRLHGGPSSCIRNDDRRSGKNLFLKMVIQTTGDVEEQVNAICRIEGLGKSL